MIYRLSIATVAIALLCNVVSGDAPEALDAAARFTKLAKQIAAEYTIEAEGRSLVLRQNPVLTWTDPENGEIYGAVFVWTDGGRPATIASIYKWYRPNTHATHEFQSLSIDPIVGSREHQYDWRCSKAGVEWKRVPSDATIGRTPAQRLTRMRLGAKRFSFQLTEKDGSVEELRMLSQPLYRFQSSGSDVVDGALFAFARGTDPEVFLLLEIRDEGEQQKLFYALARSNFLPISASYDGQEIWKVERLTRASMKAGTEPYTKFIFRDNEDKVNGTP